MKKIICLLSLAFSGFAFANDNFTAEVERTSPRGFTVIEVLSGETNIKNIYTTECRTRTGNAILSLDQYGQGYIRLNGKSCHVVGVERLAPGEERKKKVEVQVNRDSEQRGDEINKPGTTMQFHNNVN